MYLYNANAIGLAGLIRRPIGQTIENQASACLGTIGGFDRAVAEAFHFDEILSFRGAYAETAGFESDGRNVTLARAVVEGLNVLDIVKADLVVASLSGEYRRGEAESRILLAGSRVENLRILGVPVDANVQTQFFDEHDTFAKLEHSDPKFRKLFHDWGSVDTQVKRPYSGSLANVSPEWLPELRRNGLAIEIPDFGRIHLAEFFIQPSHRRLNMLRIELGSPVGGRLVIASASCNGLTGGSGTDDD